MAHGPVAFLPWLDHTRDRAGRNLKLESKHAECSLPSRLLIWDGPRLYQAERNLLCDRQSISRELRVIALNEKYSLALSNEPQTRCLSIYTAATRKLLRHDTGSWPGINNL